MTDADLIKAYDKARKKRNKALDALSELHAALLIRTRDAGGAIKTNAGYASITYRTVHVKDSETIKRLVADGTIATEVRRDEKLDVVATEQATRKGKP